MKVRVLFLVLLIAGIFGNTTPISYDGIGNLSPGSVLAQEMDGRHNGPIIGHLEKREILVTILSGQRETYYTIKDKDGRLIAAKISEDELKDRHPDLYKEINSGIAGKDAMLLGDILPNR